MSFVSVTDVWQAYGNRSILERVNLSVDEGEFISIVGASGCGKSTFLRMLLAEETPIRGAIRIDGGAPAVEPNPERGVVFQRYSVFPHLTVRGQYPRSRRLQDRLRQTSRSRVEKRFRAGRCNACTDRA